MNDAAPTFEISRVPREEIGPVLMQIMPEIRRALIHFAGDCLGERDLIALLRQGALELWAVRQGETVLAGIVLEIDPRERGRMLTVVLAAGRDFQSWAPSAMLKLREYAQQIGAYSSIAAWCRLGMARRLEPYGWRRKAIVMGLPKPPKKLPSEQQAMADAVKRFLGLDPHSLTPTNENIILYP